jgi:hypothetical protein
LKCICLRLGATWCDSGVGKVMKPIDFQEALRLCKSSVVGSNPTAGSNLTVGQKNRIAD